MAAVLGAWRTGFQGIFYILCAITILTIFNHVNWAKEGRETKLAVSGKVASELISDSALRAKLALWQF